MKTLLINNYTHSFTKLMEFLPGEVVVIDREELHKDYDVSSFDLIVLSGGSGVPTVMRHEDIYHNEITIVQNSKIPILGICLGVEIINIAFGGALKQLQKERSGKSEITILNSEAKVTIGKSLSVVEAHFLALSDVPECLEIIAESDTGPEIILHKEKPILGLQFHPELTENSQLTKWIFEILLKKI